MFLAFDYPVPFTTIGKRSVSNVPAQALTLMNNPFVVGQAEVWARSCVQDGRSSRERIASLYAASLGRPPEEREVREAERFLEQQAHLYGRPDDLRAWADLCHVIFNVKEFIFLK
jgi:hypothetical protein